MNEKFSISKKKISEWGLLKTIEKEIALDECIKDAKEPSLEEKQLVLKNWCNNVGIKSPEELKKWLKEEKLENEEWQKLIIRRWKWIKWCEKEFEDKIKSYYLRKKNQLDKVVYSLLRVKDKDLADELYLRLKSKEANFREIAEKYSEGPEKKFGGEIGPVPLSQAHPLLAKLLQISRSGQLWPPKKLNDWWIIVRLESIINSELNEELRKKLFFEMGEEHLLKLISNKSSESISNIELQAQEKR